MATSDTVKIYGFVVDTAHYNRDFATNPTGIASVDQGACCLTDKVRNMFGTVEIIKDPRESRIGGSNLSNVTGSADSKLSSPKTFLDGSMSIIYDSEKLTDEMNMILKNLSSSDQMKALFSYIEILGNYQKFTTNPVYNPETMNIDGAVALDIDEAATKAAEFASAAHVEHLIEGTESEAPAYIPIVNSYAIYTPGGTDPTKFSVPRYVRDHANFSVLINDVHVEFHLCWGSSRLLSTYPLSKICGFIYPCEREKLYELLDNYRTVSTFASNVSNSTSNKVHMIVADDDHTGVYSFTTPYYAYPDTQPTNTFNLTFGIVYKGAVPSADDIKSKLSADILAIDPSHDVEDWIKKLPGLFSKRRFFLIPLYHLNEWEDNSDNPTKHRLAIVDPSKFYDVIKKTIGVAYADDRKQYAQVLFMKNNPNYPILCVPHWDNGETSRYLTNLYGDFLGISRSDDVDEFSLMSRVTQDFTNHLVAALADAANNANTTPVDGTVDGTAWVKFTPSDITTYYILSKNTVKF